MSDQLLSLLESRLPRTGPAGQGVVRILAKAWILNMSHPLVPGPWSGTTDADPPGALFRRARQIEDFPELETHRELHAQVSAMAQVLPLTAAGLREARRQAPPVLDPWAAHLASTALRQVVWAALSQSAVHGMDPQDLFQEGILEAFEAAGSYLELGEQGGVRPFRSFANLRIWRRVDYYCLANRHLIRHPAADRQGVAGRWPGAPWAHEPVGLRNLPGLRAP
jgi:hypothetical protein